MAGEQKELELVVYFVDHVINFDRAISRFIHFLLAVSKESKWGEKQAASNQLPIHQLGKDFQVPPKPCIGLLTSASVAPHRRITIFRRSIMAPTPIRTEKKEKGHAPIHSASVGSKGTTSKHVYYQCNGVTSKPVAMSTRCRHYAWQNSFPFFSHKRSCCVTLFRSHVVFQMSLIGWKGDHEYRQLFWQIKVQKRDGACRNAFFAS